MTPKESSQGVKRHRRVRGKKPTEKSRGNAFRRRSIGRPVAVAKVIN